MSVGVKGLLSSTIVLDLADFRTTKVNGFILILTLRFELVKG
jgi:hypothetical protein